jgi:hypothetical protein
MSLVITDQMRLFGLAVVPHYKEFLKKGFSETFAAMAAVAEASVKIDLTPEERESIKLLIKQGRLAELAGAEDSCESQSLEGTANQS